MLALADRAGLDAEAVLDVIAAGAGRSSRMLALRGPQIGRRRKYDLTASVRIFRKDLRMIAEFARAAGGDTPLLSAAAAMYDRAEAAGWDERDVSVVHEVYLAQRPSLVGVQQLEMTRAGDGPVCVFDDLRDLRPVGTAIEAHADPAAVPDVRRHVEPIGLLVDELPCTPGGAAHQSPSRRRRDGRRGTSRTSSCPAMKKVGAPWLRRSLASGSAMQMARTRSSGVFRGRTTTLGFRRGS